MEAERGGRPVNPVQIDDTGLTPGQRTSVPDWQEDALKNKHLERTLVAMVGDMETTDQDLD